MYKNLDLLEIIIDIKIDEYYKFIFKSWLKKI